MELVFAQSWSKWNWYLLKIEGKTQKNLVKVLDKKMLEVVQSYEIVGNFNNFKAKMELIFA
jgi:hypothetical protein